MTTRSNSDLLTALQLILVRGVGPRLQRLLLDEFGSPDRVLAASAEALRRIRGVGPAVVEAVRDGRDPTLARDQLRRCQEHSIRLVDQNADDYPQSLLELPDAPFFCLHVVR